MTSGLSLKMENPLVILTINEDNEKDQICILCSRDGKTHTQTNKISVMIIGISSTTVGDKALARGNPFSVECLCIIF